MVPQEQHHLLIRHLETSEEQPVVLLVTRDESKEEKQWVITAQGYPEWSGASRRFAAALRAVREAMEADGWLLLCNASRVDVASFNRTAVLRGGRYGWVLSVTKKFDHKKDEQVLLLEPLGDSSPPASLSKQRRFREEWKIFQGFVTSIQPL